MRESPKFRNDIRHVPCRDWVHQEQFERWKRGRARAADTPDLVPEIKPDVEREGWTHGVRDGLWPPRAPDLSRNDDDAEESAAAVKRAKAIAAEHRRNRRPDDKPCTIYVAPHLMQGQPTELESRLLEKVKEGDA